MKRAPFGWLLVMLLMGCGAAVDTPSTESEAATTTATPATNATPEAESATPEAESATTPSAPALAPGRYCYVGSSDTLTGAVRFTMNEATQVEGDSVVAIHNDETGYYSSYAQKFTGELVGDRAELTVLTWIEYDLQEVDETWQVSPDRLTVNDAVFVAADCDDPAVADYFIGPDGLDSDALLVDLPPAQRVEFAPGASQTTLENSVVRGDRDVYLLGAQGGQRMTLDIYSLEENAVFDLISPSGMIMAREAISESLPLPQTGDYTVIVGGTRGNATYTLEVAIE